MKPLRMLCAAVALVLVASCSGQREGETDTQLDKPVASQLVGHLVHSTEEYTAKRDHLSSWYVVKQADGSIVRLVVPTGDIWYCLLAGQHMVYRVSETWMDAYAPVAQNNPAACSDTQH